MKVFNSILAAPHVSYKTFKMLMGKADSYLNHINGISHFPNLTDFSIHGAYYAKLHVLGNLFRNNELPASHSSPLVTIALFRV